MGHESCSTSVFRSRLGSMLSRFSRRSLVSEAVMHLSWGSSCRTIIPTTGALIPHAHDDVPVFIGEATQRILRRRRSSRLLAQS